MVGHEAYAAIAEELDTDRPAADVLAELDPEAVEIARSYAKRSHKRWPPRPSRSGWHFTIH